MSGRWTTPENRGPKGLLCYNVHNRRPSTDKLPNIENPLNLIQRNTSGGNLLALKALRRRVLQQPVPIYLVGGPVRDALLGRPFNDLDFSVEGDAQALAQWLAGEIGGKTVFHPRFGTATVIATESRTDLVMARRETYAHPGALPQVTPGGIREDLARRDFSINALAIPLTGDPPLDPGQRVLDNWEGLDDLRSGVVRILHDESFIDDPTRVFRAIRYEQRLGFRIEERTLAQLKNAVDHGLVANLSPDRLRHEVQRIFEEEDPGSALARCLELGALQAVHSSLGKLALSNLNALEPLTVKMDETGSERSMVYLSAIVSCLSRQEGEALISRLNMPEAWRRVVRDTIHLQDITDDLNDESLSGSQLARLLESLSIEAVSALWLTNGNNTVCQNLHRYFTELRYVEPALDGQDLLRLGVPPGPLVGQILGRLRDDALDGRVTTEAGQRRLVEELMAESNANVGAKAIRDAPHG